MHVENINLGIIKANKKHTFSALLTNDTEHKIVVTHLKVGCSSCTDAKIQKNMLSSFDTSLINIAYTPSTLGIHDKFIIVYYTENNESKDYKFFFKGNVV